MSRLCGNSLRLCAALVCRRWAELAARETVWCQLCLWHARSNVRSASPWLLSLAKAHTDPRDTVELPRQRAGKSWQNIYEDENARCFDAATPHYAREQKDGERHTRRLKLCVFGSDACGKTSFVFRFADNEFIPGRAMTMGLDYIRRSVGINGQRFLIEFWDTTGKQRFVEAGVLDPLIQGWAKGQKAHGIFLCFNLADHYSFAAVRETFAPRFLPHLETPRAVVLVGLHADLARNPFTLEERRRQVSEAEVEELLAELGDQLGVRPRYFECSSLTGDGVEQAVRALAHDVLSSEFQFKRGRLGTVNLEKLHDRLHGTRAFEDLEWLKDTEAILTSLGPRGR